MESAAMVKLGRPRPGGAVRRERLFALLDRARDRPVVWVSGPAGAGKTTLATSWIEERRLPCLWYQLGEEDGDVASFFYHLGLAAAPLLAPGPALPLLTALSRAGLRGFSRLFFQELFRRVPPGTVVVFDNVEQAPPGDAAWQTALAVGLDLVPPGITALFLGRGAPLPALSRHRAWQLVHTVGFDELRLSAEECGHVAQAILGRALTGELAHRVFRLADGWAAGLVLLLEWARHEGGLATELQATFVPALFDYFATEVLERVDPRTQRFLLETAVLPSTTAAIAARLTDRPDSERLLSMLHAQSFFTERHPGPEPSYRYHPAFRQFLLERLAATVTAPELAALEERAAAALAAAGRSEEALALLCRAGRLDGAVPLLRAVAPALVAQGRTDTLLGWLARLPAEGFAGEPWLSHWRGVCRTVVRHPDAIADLERALDGSVARDDAEGAYAAWSELVDAVATVFVDLAVLDGLLDRHTALRDRFPTIPGDVLESRVAAARYMAMAARRASDPELPALRARALDLLRRHAGATALLRLAAFALIQDATRGDERHGELLCRSLDGVDLAGVPPVVALAWCFGRATHATMRGDLAAGVAVAGEGLELARAAGVGLYTAELLTIGSLAAALAEDAATARRLLEELDEQVRTGHIPPYPPRDFIASYLLLIEGNLEGALEGSRRNAAELARLGYGPGAMYAAALHAVVLAARDPGAETAAAIAHGLELARATGGARGEYAMRVLEADRRDRAGEPGAAEALARAFALGAAHGFARSALFTPRPVLARACERAFAAGVEVAYAAEVAAAHGLDRPRPRAAIEVQTLGPFAVRRDGEPLPPSRKLPRRPLALLKALVAFGEREVPEAVLGGALWPDADGDAAHEALAINLRRLRRLLGDARAVTRAGNQLSLDPERVWTDVRALAAVLGAIDERLAAGGAVSDDGLDALGRSMLALYRGDFLAAEDAPWAIAPRERLRAQVVRRAEALGRHWEARGAWDHAIACYQTALDAAELSEPLYAGLARCYEAQGRRAEAVATQARYRRTMVAAGLAAAK